MYILIYPYQLDTIIYVIYNNYEIYMVNICTVFKNGSHYHYYY